MYFTLLATGEAKVGIATSKASVPQSKAYDVLESLRDKGFVELIRAEKPKMYRALDLEQATGLVTRNKQRQIRELEHKERKLSQILEVIEPLHRKYEGLRLFSPSYQRTRFQEKGGDGYGED